MYKNLQVAAIVPARDEAGAIGIVVHDLLDLRAERGRAVVDRVVVVDNNSSDDTAAIARAAGAVVVHESAGAYGAACLRGMAVVGEPDIVLFVDGDASCVAGEALLLLEAIADGADFALGVRVAWLREPASMTWPQRWGNALAVTLIWWLWRRRFRDLGPFRALRTAQLKTLDMRDRRFGWTTEMQVKALLAGLSIVEVPVSVRRRVGRSKISGTVRGTALAAQDIIGTILRLWWLQWRAGGTNRAGRRAMDSG